MKFVSPAKVGVPLTIVHIRQYTGNIWNFTANFQDFRFQNELRFQQDFKEAVRDFKGVLDPLCPVAWTTSYYKTDH